MWNAILLLLFTNHITTLTLIRRRSSCHFMLFSNEFADCSPKGTAAYCSQAELNWIHLSSLPNDIDLELIHWMQLSAICRCGQTCMVIDLPARQCLLIGHPKLAQLNNSTWSTAVLSAFCQPVTKVCNILLLSVILFCHGWAACT